LLKERSDLPVVVQRIGEDAAVPEAIENSLVLGDALLKKVVIERAVAVEGMVPDAQQNAQPLGDFLGLTPEMLHQERGGLVHGVPPLPLLERGTPLLQCFRGDSTRCRNLLAPPAFVWELVQDFHGTSPTKRSESSHHPHCSGPRLRLRKRDKEELRTAT